MTATLRRLQGGPGQRRPIDLRAGDTIIVP
jgi:hypothetical protein